MPGNYNEIYIAVRCIPEGKVATYGQIARLSGRPNGARQVGYALSASTQEDELPWHRVINARGEVSTRAHPDYEDYQRLLLEAEGVEFDLRGRVNLKLYQWQESDLCD